jgi:hypothetical protein
MLCNSNGMFCTKILANEFRMHNYTSHSKSVLGSLYIAFLTVDIARLSWYEGSTTAQSTEIDQQYPQEFKMNSRLRKH